MVMNHQNRHRRRGMANNHRKYESIERETRMLAAGMSGIFKYNSIYGPTVLNDSMLGHRYAARQSGDTWRAEGRF